MSFIVERIIIIIIHIIENIFVVIGNHFKDYLKTNIIYFYFDGLSTKSE